MTNKSTQGPKSSQFRNSASYWEERYQSGRNSGAGSYGRLADYKANFLNEFVAEHQITSVIEWGSGDGNQLSLAKYPQYTGLDVSKKSIELCQQKFAADQSKSFILLDDNERTGIKSAELGLSLDVIYHLVEDEIFEKHLNDLFSHAGRYVIIYSSNSTEGGTANHVRHRNFTDWVEHNINGWELQQKLENPYPYDETDPENTSFANFFIYATT